MRHQDPRRLRRPAAGAGNAERRDADEVAVVACEHRRGESQRVPESRREVETERESLHGVPVPGGDRAEEAVAARRLQRAQGHPELTGHGLHVGDGVLEGRDVHAPDRGGARDPDVGPPERTGDPDHVGPRVGRGPGGVGHGRRRVDVVAHDRQEARDPHRGVTDRVASVVGRSGGGDEVGRRRPGIAGDDRFDRHRELRPSVREPADEGPTRPDPVEDEQDREGGEAGQHGQGNAFPARPWSPPAGRGGLRGHRRRPYRRWASGTISLRPWMPAGLEIWSFAGLTPGVPEAYPRGRFAEPRGRRR